MTTRYKISDISFINNFAPQDLIAILIILGGLLLKLKGADGVVSLMLISVAFYYFGKKNELLKSYINCQDTPENTK